MLIEEWRRIPKTLAFDESEYRTRQQRLCAAMAERGLDALWLHSTENLCYLTGFQTPGYYFVQTLLINADGDMRLVTRYLEQTNAFAFTCLAPEILRAYPDEADPATEIVAAIRELGLDRAAIGSATCTRCRRTSRRRWRRSSEDSSRGVAKGVPA